jgi:hypothetical protein
MKQPFKSSVRSFRSNIRMEKIKETKSLQYIARATVEIDATMLHALNDVAAQTKNSTHRSMEAFTDFVEHSTTHLEVEITYRASGLVKKNLSDSAYVVGSEARSRAGGAISVIAKIIESFSIISSAAEEAEVGAMQRKRYHYE